MQDSDLRGLERAAQEGMSALRKCAARHRLKRSDRSAGLDLLIPQAYGVVGVGRSRRYGTSLGLLRKGAGEVHPFYEGKTRPLTFKETIEAVVSEYEQNGNKVGPLFETWLDTCTGIWYKGGTSKFRIVPVEQELLTLTPKDAKEFLRRKYNDGLPELDAKDDIYNTWLRQDQVVRPDEKDPKKKVYHKGWLAALEGDGTLLEKYVNIVFPEVMRRYRKDTAMAFWLVQNPEEDQLRALCADGINSSGVAVGSRILNGGARFARVRPLYRKGHE
ncbi:hypothetical protein HY489_04845 [Candidatus Woesearchaeota archaeon]|nr:hypothetical protein [Candidatus Woesearchaeota archaeon]